ncbi:MAG TPA: LysM domain-containing protein [Solirubrobacteraceae bacterium]|nr:LysM domain-containing protein [Solirubrobacteraceae bacterium]
MVAKIARFLAPIALAAVGVGVYLIVHSTLKHQTTTITTTSSKVATGHKSKARHHHRVPKFYIVKSGDTLGSISSRTHVSVPTLTSLNPSLESNPNSLQAGQRLRLRR